MDSKKYYADVRIFVEAESVEEAAQELNDAVSYVVGSAGFLLCGYDNVVDMDICQLMEIEKD